MIAIVQYNAGNTGSVQNALTRLGCEHIVTDDRNELLRADKVIFPGVGEARSAMNCLREKGLDAVLKSLNQPLLGICLGLQLMCSYSEEGETECLRIFPNRISRFVKPEIVPHVGWNNVSYREGKLFKEIPQDTDFYFVHSFFADLSEDTAAVCNYGESFSAALARDNFYAVQFHPEKSAAMGQQILKNFLAL
ncbi:MAG TPA: imidazole glycerol phosphate synthase subunit HisH [Ginsengibacter sp.]|nr:imidazole glycerol phosphate synthase subunit HisH [Ginsengibacter sp.]HRP16958.1 imidazole glycerol phosphate synthase subunit HisH [Ginsengibacter sp.]